MATSFRSVSKGLWQVLFELERSVWCAVLPYCVLNCSIMIVVEVLAKFDVKIAFSPAGHGLMALIVSYLVVSKVNLTYDRYMACRHATGHALSCLRELNQTALTLTVQKQASPAAIQWREKVTAKTIDLLDCTIRVIKDEEQTAYLARNDCGCSVDSKRTDEDPMVHVQALRSHLYNGNIIDKKDRQVTDFQLLERVTLVNMLNDYVHQYRNLLTLASTPIPFPLIQMARTFLFLWTFSIPLVLRGVVSGEALAALVFVFFLTYGFIGLELVAMKLMHPFGDEVNDLNVSGMREATLIGIENDLRLFGAADNAAIISDRRVSYSLQKAKPPSVNMSQQQMAAPTSSNNSNINTTSSNDSHEAGMMNDSYDAYHSMSHLT